MEASDKGNHMVLSIECEFFGEVNPNDFCYCKLFIKEDLKAGWEEIGITETMPTLNSLSWDQKFNVIYKFQSHQIIKISIFKQHEENSTLIGISEGHLSKIISVSSQLELKNPNEVIVGRISIVSEEQTTSKLQAFMVLAGKNLIDLDTFSKSDPFIRIFKKRQGNWKLIHQSNVVENDLNPEWDPISIDYNHLCNCDRNNLIKVECYDYDDTETKEFMGSCEFQAGRLTEGAEFQLINPNKLVHGAPKVTGALVVKKFDLHEEESFIDYIRRGMNINLNIAIDYTTSNGDPSEPNSLHYIKEEELNEYQSAISILGSILSNYDSDHQYAVYGFGGKPSWLGSLSHGFPLNKDPSNPYIQGYEEVLNIYRSTLSEIELSGPTHFSELINIQIDLAKRSGPNTYNILLILSDGDLHDYQETVDAIVAASYLPISILIIGIGYENFLQLKKLDGDQVLLVDSHNKKSARDIVQFVAFRKVSTNLSLFGKEALMEIPGQLMSYMKFNKA